MTPTRPVAALGDAAGGEPLFDLLARWQRTLDISGRASASTRRTYRRLVLNYVADITMDPSWKGTRDPLQATEDDIIEYLDQVTTRGGYRNQVIRALASFYGCAADREPPIIERNPLRKLHPTDRKYGNAPSLDPGDLRAVLKAAESVDPRARWAITLQYVTAGRVGELVGVAPADVSWHPPRVLFRVAKNDDPREVVLSEQGILAVQRLVGLLDYRRRASLTGFRRCSG